VSNSIVNEEGCSADNVNVTGMRVSSDTSRASSLSNGLTTVDSLSVDHTSTDSMTRLSSHRRTIAVDSQHHDLDVKRMSNHEPSSFSQKIGQVMSNNFQTPPTAVTTSSSSSVTSEILRRSTMTEVGPSRSLHGPGSAVARLFGTSSGQPGVRVPAGGVAGTIPGPRGRRSLHHSWVRPGRTAFSDTEAATVTLTSVATSRAATSAVTTASSDINHASNHI